MSARGDPSPWEYRLARVRCAGNSPTTRTRLCEVANGGQTVVASQTASLVGEALLAGSSVHDPGYTTCAMCRLRKESSSSATAAAAGRSHSN